LPPMSKEKQTAGVGTRKREKKVGRRGGGTEKKQVAKTARGVVPFGRKQFKEGGSNARRGGLKLGDVGEQQACKTKGVFWRIKALQKSLQGE